MLNSKCEPEAVRILFLDHAAQLSGGELALLAFASGLYRARLRSFLCCVSES